MRDLSCRLPKLRLNPRRKLGMTVCPHCRAQVVVDVAVKMAKCKACGTKWDWLSARGRRERLGAG